MLHMVCFTVSQNLFNTLSAVYVWAYDHDVQGIYVPPTPHADSNYTQKKEKRADVHARLSHGAEPWPGCGC